MEAFEIPPIEEQLKILRNVSIFQEIDQNTLLKISKAMRPIHFPANTDILHKGDQGTSMYIIVQGKVRAHDGQGHTFGFMNDGQFFGEYALLDTEARSASIEAVEDTNAFVLQQQDFYEILGNNIDVVRSLLGVFTRRLRTNNALQEELASSNRKIQQQNAKIESQNRELAEKNQSITSSINYAKRIQAVMLPAVPEIKEHFEGLFIFYRPRNIVSGDFYWYAEAHGRTYFAVSDCTGHGVPGALMSMTGAMLLNHVVKENGIEDVDLILKELHLGVANLLNSKESNIQDGMDIGLCCIDRKEERLYFAGAKQALMYVSDGEMNVIKPNREPIGGNAYQFYRTYTKHTLPLKKGNVYYISSDGFKDQFGKNNRKFMRKKFRELLYEIYQRPFEEQHQILEKVMDDWMGDVPQTDDMLVAGFKVW